MNHDEGHLFSDQPFLIIQAEPFCRELEHFVSRHGGQVARRLPLVDRSPSHSLVELAMKVMTAEADLVVFQNCLTARHLLSTKDFDFGQRKLVEALRDVTTIAGSRQVERELLIAGVQPHRVNSSVAEWRNLLQLLDQNGSLLNQLILIEKTVNFGSIRAGLEARGASVFPFASIAEDLKSRVALPELDAIHALPQWRLAVLMDGLAELQSLIVWLNDQFDTLPSNVLVLALNEMLWELAESHGFSSRNLELSRPINEWGIAEAREIARHLW